MLITNDRKSYEGFFSKIGEIKDICQEPEMLKNGPQPPKRKRADQFETNFLFLFKHKNVVFVCYEDPRPFKQSKKKTKLTNRI